MVSVQVAIFLAIVLTIVIAVANYLYTTFYVSLQYSSGERVSVCGLVRGFMRLVVHRGPDMLHHLEGKRTVSRKSPLYLAERAKTLTLIIRSIEDYGTRLGKALPFFTALKLHGVVARPVIFPEKTNKGEVSTPMENFKEILNRLDRYVPQS